MPAKKGYILVEGYGELEAAHNLVSRLSNEVGLYLPWSNPLRWPNIQHWTVQRKGGVKNGAEFIRGKTDVAALLILRDEDDECPRELAPRIAMQLRSLNLPFPTAYVLLHPEYEVLFLPCLELMELSFPRWDGQTWECRRGIKEWLSSQLPRGRSYKETTDQLQMTRKLDFKLLREADVPCFGSLERSLVFLSNELNSTGKVYPETE